MSNITKKARALALTLAKENEIKTPDPATEHQLVIKGLAQPIDQGRALRATAWCREWASLTGNYSDEDFEARVIREQINEGLHRAGRAEI